MTIRPGDELHAILRRMRRRLYVVRLAPLVPVALGATVLGALALLRLQSAAVAIVAAVSLGLGFVVGAGVWVRGAGVTRIAAIIDRRCGLQDRVVTALQFADATDDIASFILNDALRHLRTITPARVFPFLPGPIGVGVTALLVLASGGFLLPSRAISETSGVRAPAARGPAMDNAPAGTGTAVQEATSTAPRAHASASTTDAPRTPPMPSSRSASAVDGIQAGSPTSAGAAGRAPGRGTSPSSGAARAGEARIADGAALDGIGRAGGAGRGRTGTADETRLAETGTVSVAMRRAEAAIARGEVPVRYRAYVRDYFAALNIGIDK